MQKHTDMKKRISIITLAALLAAASCQVAPVPEPRPSAGELTVSGLSSAATKGFVTGATLFDTAYENLGAASPATAPRTIRLSAWLYPCDTDGTEEQEYFRGETFSRSDADGMWHHDPAVYWPAGDRLDFLGYSSTVALPATAVRWDPGMTTESLSLKVGQDFLYDDLLYGYLAPRTSAGGPAPMVFRHSQAWLQFNVKASAPDMVVLESLELEGVYTEGDLRVEHDAADPRIAWSFAAAEARTLDVDPADHSAGYALTATPERFDVLVPQQAMRSIVIRYRFAGVAKTFRYEYVLAPTSTWEAGCRYVYDITVSPREIVVDPAVVEWDTDYAPVVAVMADSRYYDAARTSFRRRGCPSATPSFGGTSHGMGLAYSFWTPNPHSNV